MELKVVRTGATVRGRDGNKLGKVVARGEGVFVVATGVPATPEYAVRESDILEIRDEGELVLARGLEELRRRDEAEGPAPRRRT